MKSKLESLYGIKYMFREEEWKQIYMYPFKTKKNQLLVGSKSIFIITYLRTRASRWRIIAYPRASAIAYLRVRQNSKCVPPGLIHRAITCDTFKALAKNA